MIGCSFSLPSYQRRRALYEPGEAYEEAQTPALCDYTARLHSAATLRTCGIVAPYRAGSVIHRGYPQCGELTRM